MALGLQTAARQLPTHMHCKCGNIAASRAAQPVPPPTHPPCVDGACVWIVGGAQGGQKLLINVLQQLGELAAIHAVHAVASHLHRLEGQETAS